MSCSIPPDSGKLLAGQRVVVTRPREQSSELAARLRMLGAEVIELPAIETRPPEDYTGLDAAIAQLNTYDWLVFTSANGVRFFLQRLKALGGSPDLIGARICAIGPATRAALEQAGLRVDLVPREYVAESLIEAFAQYPLEGRRILLPRAAAARELAPQALRQRGARVDVVEAYRTLPPADLPRRASMIFGAQPKPDWVTFTSASTVVNLLTAVGAESLRDVRIASIGPVTSAAVRRFGLEVAAEAQVYTSAGLVEAIARSLKGF